MENLEPSGVGGLNDKSNPIDLPSLTTTLRANPEAGFSVVTWVGDRQGTHIAHGLNSPVKFYIVKNRDINSDWM